MAEPVRSKDKPISRSPKLTRGARITGEQRGQLAGSVARRYQTGESIRSIAEDLGRSYGFVQSLLTQAEVPLRSRGGDTRGADAVARRALVSERVRKVRAQLADGAVRLGGSGEVTESASPAKQPKVAKKVSAAVQDAVEKPSKHSHKPAKDSGRAEKPAKSEKKKKKKKSKKDKHKDQ